MQAVAEFRDHAQSLETEQRERIAPGLHALLVPVTHLRLDPVHLVSDAEFIEHLQEGGVRCAVEVVIALDLQAIEIEAGGHAANAIVSLEHHRLVAIARQLIGDGQTHRSGAEHGDPLALVVRVHGCFHTLCALRCCVLCA